MNKSNVDGDGCEEVDVVESTKSVRQIIIYYNYLNKTHSVLFFYFDLEIELKTMIDDIFHSLYDEHLQEKVLANEAVGEFDLSFDNRYIASDIHNSQVVSHSCENSLMKEDIFYDDIDGLSISLVEGS